MHSTTTLYDTIKSGNHVNRVVLELETVSNGVTEYVELDESSIYSLKTMGSVFADNTPSIGSFCAREIDVSFKPPIGKTIPKRARMRVFTYLDNGTQQSERIPKGVFFIDTRDYNSSRTRMFVHGYDAAIKFDTDIAETDFEWPVSPTTLILQLAQSVGVSVVLPVDLITLLLTNVYRVPLTICTKREMIRYIAAAIGCNAVIDDRGRLRFLFLKIDTTAGDGNYLVDEAGNRIVIGGDRLFV